MPGAYLASVYFLGTLYPMGLAAPAGSLLSGDVYKRQILYYAVKRMLPALQNGITETGNEESTVCWYGYLKQDTIPAVTLRIL